MLRDMYNNRTFFEQRLLLLLLSGRQCLGSRNFCNVFFPLRLGILVLRNLRGRRLGRLIANALAVRIRFLV